MAWSGRAFVARQVVDDSQTSALDVNSVRPGRSRRAAYPVGVSLTLRLRRLAYRLAYRILQVVWFVWRPRMRGVKCLVTCRDRVLLVRHTYGSRAWDVPGGAMKRGE